MSSHRLEKIESSYQKEIANLLLLRIRDPRLSDVYVTRVKFTPDLGIAKVYFQVAGGRVREKEVITGFEHSKGFLKHELSRLVKTKYTPDLKFYYDESAEHQLKMDLLFRQIQESPNVEETSETKDSQKD